MAIHYHRMEIELCEENDLVFESACAHRFLGDVYRDQGDIQNAKKSYHIALGMIRQQCDHVSSFEEEHACSSSGMELKLFAILAIRQEQSFLSTCSQLPILLEYYRSLCNLALVYLNEVV